MHFRLRDIAQAKFCETPGFVHARRLRGAPGRGIRYEADVHRHLSGLFPTYLPAQWYEYTLRSEPGRKLYAQSDGLIFDFERGLITIVEVKYKHCSEAYFQVVDKYFPLLEWIFNRQERLWDFSFLEICYWFDRDTSFPVIPSMRKTLSDFRPNTFHVHIYRAS